MCFDRNRDVKFLECDYLLVQQCVKLILVTIVKSFLLTKYRAILPASLIVLSFMLLDGTTKLMKYVKGSLEKTISQHSLASSQI